MKTITLKTDDNLFEKVSVAVATYNGSTYPYKSTIAITLDQDFPWLIYNQNNAAATFNDFELEFNSDKLGDTVSESGPTQGNTNTARRIQC